MTVEPIGRSFCYRCHKPGLTCICAIVPRVHNRTPVWILQHPRERFHPIGTARIAHLGLSRVHVDVRHRDLDGPPRGFPEEDVVLLYPKQDAQPLDELGARSPRALVVLDGTWAHARTLYRDNPWLHDLPRFALKPPEPSRYRIRKEPAPDCVSTIESLVYALTLLEPETEGLADLIGAFTAMIDEQIRIYRARRTGSRRSARAPKPLLGADREHLVFVEAEAMTSEGRRRLVHWCAVRPSTGETFDGVARPPQRPDPIHLFHMGLTEAEIDGGVSADDLAGAWRRFRRSEDVLVGWNRSTLELRPAGDDGPVRVLKSAFCNVRRGSRGTLEQMIAREAVDPPSLGLRGRAGRRLAAAHAMFEHLERLARR